MKLGIVGTGKIVNELLPHLSETGMTAHSILYTERSTQKAKDMMQKYNIPSGYTDYSAMLKSDVEVIYIALPNHLHFEYSLMALNSGKHVICEKPMTSNKKELDLLINAAKSSSVMLIEAVTVYHLPAFKKMCDNIEKIGKIKLISMNFSQYSSRYDAFLQGEVLPAFDFTKSGGALMDINVYNIYALLGMFGAPNSIIYKPNIEKNIDVSGILMLGYPNFQAVCIGAKDCSSVQPSVIQGEKGTVYISEPVSRMTEYEIILNNGKHEKFVSNDDAHRMVYEFKEFYRILSQNDQTAYEKLISQSLNAAFILDSARKSTKISFPADDIHY